MGNTRKYKDGFFRSLFGTDKNANEKFLDVYNALMDTDLKLENTKIVDVSLDKLPCERIRNDVAKTINNQLVVLFEHQSTINDNMPLRMLEYIVAIYKMQTKGHAKDKYKNTLKLLRPVFVVFYNGDIDYPTESVLRLSDMYLGEKTKDNALELTVRVININANKKAAILQKSPALKSYTTLCTYIKEYQKQGLSDCVKQGVQKAINSGVLVDYLKDNFMEVVGMIDEEYDYDMDMEARKEATLEKERLRMVRIMLINGEDATKVAMYTTIPLDQVQQMSESLQGQ